METFGVIMLLCLILFGIVQYAMMLTATEIIQFGADSAVRARAVGLNAFMASKANVLATIPNAGERITPYAVSGLSQTTWENANDARSAFYSSTRSRSSTYVDDISNFPIYLGATSAAHADSILSYERSYFHGNNGPNEIAPPRFTFSGDMIRATVRQAYPLTMPLFRAFSDSDSIDVEQQAELAHHAELFLE
ncbi:hypothetical protein P0Y35_10915 [Kiritimatiellaeota bacterium B1221]|nr:hypothetical protein [Kiritimatiellaeota bacterium B1221]